MAKQLKDLITLIASKANIDLAQDASFADLLSANVTVSDDAFAKVESGFSSLLTIEAAKNNSQLAAHFKAAALLPADTEINNLLNELGFDDTVKGEFTSEKSTYKKIGLLAKKVQELTAAKASAKGGDKDTFQKEIDRLNAAIASEKTAAQQAIASANENANSAILEYAIDSILGTKNYSDAIPASVRVTTAKTLLQQEFQKRGIKPVYNSQDRTIKLVKADNPELEYYDNNSKVGLDELTDNILSAHTMLKVSALAPAGGGAKDRKIITGDDGNKGNQQLQSANENNLAALEAATK